MPEKFEKYFVVPQSDRHRYPPSSRLVFFKFPPPRSANRIFRGALKIDGENTIVDQTDPFGLQFPFWLTSGQTVAVGASVKSVSVIEFTENGTALEYSGVLNITSTSPVSVPDGKVWKLESASKVNNSSSYRNATFSAAGTYTFSVPACAEEICIEIWGGGGGGAGGRSGSPYAGGAGGGGGGFGSGCFAVTPGATYTVIVGDGGTGGAVNTAGGTGQTSSVEPLISASGGTGGTSTTAGGVGGTGGTSTSASYAVGGSGRNGEVWVSSCATTFTGAGGAAGNGGAGGLSVAGTNGAVGTSPGGAGSGGGCTAGIGGRGAPGKVVISW